MSDKPAFSMKLGSVDIVGDLIRLDGNDDDLLFIDVLTDIGDIIKLEMTYVKRTPATENFAKHISENRGNIPEFKN